MATVLEVAQRVADVVGVEPIQSLISSSDQHAQSMRVLLNRSGKNFTRMRNSFSSSWTVFDIETSIETVPQQSVYPLPQGFLSFVEDTLYREEGRFPLTLVNDRAEWARITTWERPVALSYWYRRVATPQHPKAIELYPVPEQAETIVFEYTTENWLREAAGSENRLANITSDVNVLLMDDILVELDLTWRFKRNRGLDYAFDLAEFETERDRHLALDTGQRIIPIGGSVSQYGRRDIPSATWPGVIRG